MHQSARTHRPQQAGFMLLFVFLLAAMSAIGLYLELPRVAFESQRLREEILIDRGLAYRRAIQLYVRDRKQYPQSLDDLEKSGEKRYLRHRYRDPMTGKDEWRLIHIGPNGEFTDSLIYKPRQAGKEASQNTFITEGPAIGSTGPEAQAGAVTVANRLRASDQPNAPGQAPVSPEAANPEVAPGGYFGQPPGIPPAPGDGGVGPGGGQQAGPYNPEQPYPFASGREAARAAAQAAAMSAQTQQGAMPGAVGFPPVGQPYPSSPAPGTGSPTAPGGGFPTPPQNYPGQTAQPIYNPGGVPTAPPVYNPGGFPAPGQPGQPGVDPAAFNPVVQLIPGLAQGGSLRPAPFAAGAPPASSQTGGVVPQAMQPQGVGQSPYSPGFNPQGPVTNPSVAQQIMNMLTRPRPAGASATTATGMTTIGAGIAGIASKFEAEGIKLFNERSFYHEWEFLYDFQRDPFLTQGGVNLNPGGTPANRPSGAGGSSSSSGFGSPSGPGSGGFGLGSGSNTMSTPSGSRPGGRQR